MTEQGICGADCANCFMRSTCRGCRASDGCPFGKRCFVAGLCEQSPDALSACKAGLIAAFNGLHVPGMPEVTELVPLRGAFVNLTFRLPGGQTTAFWDDDSILLGMQFPAKEEGSCFGLASDGTYLMVCRYENGGKNPQLLVFRAI